MVYEIIPEQVSFFANYVNGFKNVAPVQNPNDITQLIEYKPEQGNQTEVGLKFDLFGKKLLTTLSYYHINIKDRLVEDPSNEDLLIQDGNIKS